MSYVSEEKLCLKRILTPAELEEFYEITPTWQKRGREEGWLPYIRLGRRILYDKMDVESFLNSSKVVGAAI